MKLILAILMIALFFGCVSQGAIEASDNRSTIENISQIQESKPVQDINQVNETVSQEKQIPLLEEAELFAKTTSTYSFDGSGLELINYSNGTYVFSFISGSSGYGNRSTSYQDGNPTAHMLSIMQNSTSFNVALVDGVYDEVLSILLKKTCPSGYREFEWENGTFCYRPSNTDGMPCSFSHQCEKGACEVKSSGSMGPRGVCSDYMYGCHSWLFDQTVTRVDICKEKDYP